MVYGLWLSAGGLQAQDYRQSVIANNLANAQTPGFKPERVAFLERLTAAQTRFSSRASDPSLNGITGGVFEAPVQTDFSQGALVKSDSRLDVAIQGDGFLAVQTADGIRYTRDGRMNMDADGTLIHLASGGRMCDLAGRPIVLNPGAREPVQIDSMGEVRQGLDSRGNLGVTDFVDRSALSKEGENLFSAADAKPTPAKGEIQQGFTEASGVDPVSTLVEMIAASRAYEMNATLVTMQDQALGRVVNDIGKIG